MSRRRIENRRARQGRRSLFPLEFLESRRLLTASETFNGPSLSDLILQAEQGKYTAPAAIDRMVQALQSQLQSGPLADLVSGAVDGDGFVVEVQSLEASYEANVDQQLSPDFPNIDAMLKLQGEQVVAAVVSLNQQSSVGLVANLPGQAHKAIKSLTTGSIQALDTSLNACVAASKTFESNILTLASNVSSSSDDATVAAISLTAAAEAEAYRADLHAGLQVTHPMISNLVDAAVTSFETATTADALESGSDPQSQLLAAIDAFDAAILGKTGLFGANGVVNKATGDSGSLPPANLKTSSASTMISDVSGSAPIGGPASLTATLTSADSGAGIANAVVSFTLDGAFAGIAVTDSDGIATLDGVATSDDSGTDSGGVVATFLGSLNNQSSLGSGDLNVAEPASSINSVSGTAAFGGTATLLATLLSSTNTPLAGETVTFTLDGVSVGTAVTDSNGIATLTGVATTQSVGTDTGGIVATFAGDTNNGASSGSGDLTVSQAGTTLGSVAGSAAFGGTATLVATLTSTATNAGAAGETVTFTLDGTVVGTAVTDSNGVATLSGIATSQPIGTDTGGVVASFAGDANYTAAANATGNLVVGQAATALSSVSGAVSFGGTGTLTATLLSAATNLGISGETVTFTLNGTAVGTAVTNSSGVATLTGVASSQSVGTYSDAVVASFAGDSTYAAAADAEGAFVVSQAATSLNTVAATASFGGTATLTATLLSSVTGAGVAGETVSFTLDGATVGTAVTDANGIATLSGVVTTDAVGTHSDAVVASFAGDTNYVAAVNASGDLVVSQAATALSLVSGTATGGFATLTATLTSSANNEGIGGMTVTFMLDGTSVGTAVTNAAGLATLSNVPTSDPVGTYPTAVVAGFTGTSNYVAATDVDGELVVS